VHGHAVVVARRVVNRLPGRRIGIQRVVFGGVLEQRAVIVADEASAAAPSANIKSWLPRSML
jgi:hypothetical protein